MDCQLLVVPVVYNLHLELTTAQAVASVVVPRCIGREEGLFAVGVAVLDLTKQASFAR